MSLYSSPQQQFLDSDGNPIVGGRLFFFETGTSTLKTIYSDSSFTTPRANPVLSVEGGYFPPVYLDGLYRVVLQDASGNNVWPEDADPVGMVTSGQFEPYSASATFNVPDIVKGSDNEYYRSLTNNNQGNDPTTSPANWEQLEFGRIWNAAVTYAKGEVAIGSDARSYASVIGSNLNNDPTTSPESWAIGDFLNSILDKSAPYTVEEKDRGALISVTGTTTITLLPVATAGRGFPITIYNAGSATVTVDGDGAETVNGSATQDLQAGDSLSLTTSGAVGWAGIRGTSTTPVTTTTTISSADPALIIEETDAAADNKRWRLRADTEQLIIDAQNDAQSVATSILVVDRTGTVIDTINFPNGVLQSQGNAVVTTSSGTQSIAGDKTFTGTATFNSSVTISSSTPTHEFDETDASADNGIWQWLVNAEQLSGRVANDAKSVFTPWIEIDRTGTTVNTVNFPNGDIQIAGVSIQVFASGTEMAFFQAAAPTGWTQNTTHNNKALRVVSTAGGGSGGTHGLSTPPSTDHSHTGGSHTHAVFAHFHALPLGTDGTNTLLSYSNQVSGTFTSVKSVGTSGGGGTHNQLITDTDGSSTTGNGGTVSTTTDGPTAFAPLYVDMIICSKD